MSAPAPAPATVPAPAPAPAPATVPAPAPADGEGQVISCHSVESWKEMLQKGSDPKKLIVVDFTASWCGPCRIIAPYLVELAKKIPDVLFLKVDVDELKTVAAEWEIEAMPTFLFLKEGKVIDKVVGADKVDLQRKIQMHLTA